MRCPLPFLLPEGGAGEVPLLACCPAEGFIPTAYTASRYRESDAFLPSAVRAKT